MMSRNSPRELKYQINTAGVPPLPSPTTHQSTHPPLSSLPTHHPHPLNPPITVQILSEILHVHKIK